MTVRPDSRTRVVQWATGAIGRVTLRHVIDSPDLELVGLVVHNPDKVGRDAGEIARRSRTGVVATNRREDLADLDADIVLHLPINGESPQQHVDDLEYLLSSGLNVITTVGFTYPWAVNRVLAQRLDDAAKAGEATLFGTGMNPGFMAERLGVSITTLCTQVNSLSVQELYDCTPVPSAGFIFDLCGFGQREEDFWASARGRVDFFQSLLGESMGYLIDTLRLPVDGIRPAHHVMIAERDLDLPAGVIAAGTVCGVRWQWDAVRGEDPVITVRAIWRCGPPAPGWEGEDGWEIRVEGAPRLRVDLQWLDPIGLPEKSKAVQYTTAGPVIRAIPEVMAAEPGLLTVPAPFAVYRGRGEANAEELLAAAGSART